MNSPDTQQPSAWKRRRQLAALIYLTLPTLTLLAFRTTPWQAWFRTQPPNLSYDAMWIAASAGIGLASLILLRAAPTSLRWTAQDLFEPMTAAVLALANWFAAAPGTALLWTAATFALLLALVSQPGSSEAPTSPARRSPTAWTASFLLILLAVLFLLGPVLHPVWNGPEQPFVRWHPFSAPGELVWRGIFFCFAIGMMITAWDPLRRHRPFLLVLAWSGLFHATEMAADNRMSAAMQGMNGNHEHLYGDVLGWYVIAGLSAALLILSRGREAREV